MTSSTTASPLETVKRYYALIDSGDAESAFALFADDAVVRFGDHSELRGQKTISEHVSKMLTLGKSVEHTIVRAYEFAGPEDRTTVVCEARVTYVMARSGNVIPHNAVTISEVDASGQITEQRNVGNLGPVIADHEAHA